MKKTIIENIDCQLLNSILGCITVALLGNLFNYHATQRLL